MEQALPVHLFERVISCRHCFGTLFYQGDERRHSHMRVHLLPCYIELGREDRPGLTVSDEEGLAARTHTARQLNENPDPADTVGLERHASALLRVTARWRISSLGVQHETVRARHILFGTKAVRNTREDLGLGYGRGSVHGAPPIGTD